MTRWSGHCSLPRVYGRPTLCYTALCLVLVGLVQHTVEAALVIDVDATSSTPTPPSTVLAANISAALSSATKLGVQDVELRIAPGVYNGTANCGLQVSDFVSLKLAGTFGSWNTIIDCGGAGPFLFMDTSQAGPGDSYGPYDPYASYNPYGDDDDYSPPTKPRLGKLTLEGLSIINGTGSSSNHMQACESNKRAVVMAVHTVLELKDVTLQCDATQPASGLGAVAACDSPSVRFTDVGIRHCMSVNGGGLFTYGVEEIWLQSVTMSDCAATSGDGGAVFVNGGEDSSALTILSSTFRHTSAENGGALNLQAATTYIANTSFQDSTASGITYSKGGFINQVHSLVPGNITLHGVNMTAGHAQRQGGCVMATQLVVMKDCHLKQCSAGQRGAAVYATNGLDISNSSITASVMTSTTGGGALATDASFTISRTTFSDNFGAGGALLLDGGSGIVDSCRFVNNRNDHHGGGGGLCMAEAKFVGCDFVSNHADSGGAVAVSAPGKCTFTACQFTNNSAAVSGGAISWAATSGEMQDCTFAGNVAMQGGAVHVQPGARCSIINSVLANNRASEGGALAVAGTAALDIVASVITGNRAVQGGALATFDAAVVTSSETRWSWNAATLAGGAVAASGSSRLALTDDELRNNTAMSFGGAVTVSERAVLRLGSATLDGNSALLRGGAAFVNLHGRLSAAESTFSNNTSTLGGAVAGLAQATVSLEACNVTENIAGGNGGGVHLPDESHLEATRSTFAFNLATSGGGLYSRAMQAIVAQECRFIGNRASGSGGGVFLSVGAALECTACDLISNVALVSGGGILAERPAEAVSSDSSAALWLVQLDRVRNGHVPTSLTLQNCTLANNQALGTSGGAIHIGTEVASLSEDLAEGGQPLTAQPAAGLPVAARLTNCTAVANRAAEAGGALFLSDASGRHEMFGCRLVNNTADQVGGGLVVQQSPELSLTVVDFVGNSATVSGAGMEVCCASVIMASSVRVINGTAGRGGGIAVNWPARATFTSSKISGNSATADGGGIWSSGFLALRDTTISHNEAGGYGGGWFAKQITPQCPHPAATHGTANTAIVNNDAAVGGGLYISWGDLADMEVCSTACAGCTVTDNTVTGNPHAAGANRTSLPFAMGSSERERLQPGQDFWFGVNVYDIFGQQVDMVGTFMVEVADVDTCTLDSTEHIATTAEQPSAVAAGTMGTFATFNASHGTECRLNVMVAPQVAGYPRPLSVLAVSAACSPGFAPVDGRCTACAATEMSWLGTACSAEFCKDDGLVCSGGDDVVVEEGYWVSRAPNNTVLGVYECAPKFCCQPAKGTHGCPLGTDGGCPAGRVGPLCSQCQRENATVIAGTCVTCEGANWPLLGAAAAALLGFCLFNVAINRQGASPFLKQLTFAWQLATQTMPVQEMRRGLETVASIINLSLPDLLSLPVAQGDDSGGNLVTSCIVVMTPLTAVSFGLVGPAAAALVTLLIAMCHWSWLRLRHMYRVRRGSVGRLDPPPPMKWGRYTGAAFRLVLFIYSTVGDTAVKLVNCIDVTWNNDGQEVTELRLAAQPAVVCYQGAHLPMAIVAWILVMVWVAGVPLGILAFLVLRNRRSALAGDKQAARKFGMLYAAYQPRYFFFLAPHLLRRSIAVVVGSVLLRHPILRSFWLLILVVLSVMLQLAVHPFEKLQYNIGEPFMLSALALLALSRLIETTLPSNHGILFVTLMRWTAAIALVVWCAVAGSLWAHSTATNTLKVCLRRVYGAWQWLKSKRQRRTRDGSHTDGTPRVPSIARNADSECSGGRTVLNPMVEMVELPPVRRARRGHSQPIDYLDELRREDPSGGLGGTPRPPTITRAQSMSVLDRGCASDRGLRVRMAMHHDGARSRDRPSGRLSHSHGSLSPRSDSSASTAGGPTHVLRSASSGRARAASAAAPWVGQRVSEGAADASHESRSPISSRSRSGTDGRRPRITGARGTTSDVVTIIF